MKGMLAGKIYIGLFLSCLALAVQGKAVQGPVVRSKRSNEGFSWSDCGSDPNRPLRVTALSMSPSPIHLPGSLHVSFSGQVTRDLGMSDVVLDITTERKILWMTRNISVPCIRHVGSCSLPNTCTLIDRMISEDWLGISANVGRQIRQGLVTNNLPDTCPLKAQTINVQDMTFQLPSIPRVLSYFAGGIYDAKMRFFNPANHNEEYGCIAMRLHME